jgi:hypothetical protein
MPRCPFPLLLALVLSASWAAQEARAQEPRARDVYVRRRTSIEKTVQWIGREARRHQVGQVLVVFDAATFAPPPGVTEFTTDRLFPSDLPEWFDALGNEVANAGCPIRATSSLATGTVQVGDGSWRERLETIVARPWWDDDSVQQIEPAARWIQRLLTLTESAIEGGQPGKRRMLVLISCSVTPERWVFLGNRPVWELGWRTKLRDVGTYWDEEAIAARLQRDGCLFYAIAPEALFCDFRPYVELPELPWAARPKFPPLRLDAAPRSNPVTPPAAFDEDEMRKRLDEHLKPLIPDPAARAAAVERMLRSMQDASRAPAGRRGELPGQRRRPTTPRPRPVTPGGGPPALQDSGWRFDSVTPYWFPRNAASLLFNNHAPSGYGYWPYARVAGKTGGKYFFYPFPATRWLDRCPYDPVLLDRLCPDLVHKAKYHKRIKNDRAYDAIARACRLVVDETPWADANYNDRTASAWGTYKQVTPLIFHPDWFLRRKPFEVVFEDTGDARASLMRTGTRLQEDVLPLYDKAIGILDRAIAEERSRRQRSNPRAVADLVLARYWFAMSAFHLEAFAIYAVEIERFIPERLQGQIDRWWVVYVPTIKMSDALEAYDGRELAPEDESKYKRWVLPDQPGMQGNILLIDPEDPDYRAQRQLARVLMHLDPRLRRRALDMIFSARRVMADYAMSGWGWSTYYSIAYTFIFKPLPRAEGPPPQRPGGKEPPPPTTPRGPSTTPGGSAPGGPSSGG